MSAFEKRKIIYELYNEGITSAPNLSEKTKYSSFFYIIYRIVRNIENGESIEQKKGAGRPRLLTVGDRRRLGVLVSKNRRMSVNNIRCELIQRGTVPLSKETLRTKLHSLNWEKSKGIPSPLLKPEQKERRLTWCMNHLNLDWENVTFSDESSI